MLLQVIFAVFFLFQFTENIFWNPCPSLRSTFQDISIDSRGRKRPNCVCKTDLFGDQCQFKVYVSFDEKEDGLQRQTEQRIYPFEHLKLKHYPNSSLVISWRHAKKVKAQYYVIQFRELVEHNESIHSKPWRTLAYIRSENFKNQDIKLLEIQDFSNYTLYEMNLGIFSNDNVIASVSILHDHWRAESSQDILLHDVMFSASVTWSAWSGWGSCETPRGCGKGKQKRSRVLVTNRCLSNKSEETRPCKLKSCPVNGAWSPWSLWSKCSVTCGNGTRLRRRLCNSPAPRHGGEMCHGRRHVNKTCVNEKCNQISDITTWSPVKKMKSLEFTSVIVGFAAGFIACLLITACPYLLKRYARKIREKYVSFKNNAFNYTDSVKKTPEVMTNLTAHQTPPKPPLPPPLPPPPPLLNWRPIPVQRALPCSPQPKQGFWGRPTQHMPMANSGFMEELLKAFKTFNVNTDKQFGNDSEKRPP